MVYKKMVDLKSMKESKKEAENEKKPIQPPLGKNAIISWVGENLKIFLLLVFFVLVLFVAGYFWGNKKNIKVAENANPVEKKVEKKAESRSRVTFFYSAPIKGSLAIPAGWEGKYRIEDGGNIVTFKDIINPDNINLLFTIKIISQADWDKQAEKEGVVIETKENYVFVLEKSKENPYSGVEAEKFKDMMAGVDEIIRSFKTFKFN